MSYIKVEVYSIKWTLDVLHPPLSTVGRRVELLRLGHGNMLLSEVWGVDNLKQNFGVSTVSSRFVCEFGGERDFKRFLITLTPT